MRKRWMCVVLLFAACSEKSAAPPATATPSETATATAAAAAPTPPTLAEAQRMIAESEEFAAFAPDYAAFTVPVTVDASEEDPKRSVAEDLERNGWVTIENNTVAFTDKAKNDKRFNMRQNGSFDIAPLGSKEIIAVQQVVPGNEGQVRVFFVWKLVPNEIGKEIDLLDQIFIDENEAMATLIHDGTSWSVLKITSV